MKAIAIVLLAILLSACSSGPARWAEETEAQLRCGMSVEDVRSIARREVEQRDVPRDWSTHAIRDGRTDLWLGFPEGRLRWVQVLWAQKMMKMAMYQRRDLCGEPK